MATANPPRSSNRLPLIIIALIAVVGLIAGGVFLLTRNQPEKPCKNWSKSAALRDRSRPGARRRAGTEAPITIVFDKPMNRASVENRPFRSRPK